MLFGKKQQEVSYISDAEWRFQAVLDIVKDFDRSSFKKFMEAIELAWSGYDKALRAPTRSEKETSDIDQAESALIEAERGSKK